MKGKFPSSEVTLVRGNHDPKNAIFPTGLAYNGTDYAIFVLDTSWEYQNDNYNPGSFNLDAISDLSNQLSSIPKSKPVLVLSHMPIHAYGGRNTGNADQILDVLNQYENTIFFWGHNHTVEDPKYGQIFYKGDIIGIPSGDRTINFTYLAHGSMRDGYKNNNAYGLLANFSDIGSGILIDFAYKNLQGATTSTGSVTIFSTGAVTNYRVDFNSNGGSSVDSVTVESGGTINLPTPERTGYSFEGWYSDSGFSNVFTSSTPVNSNMTLYAKWKQVTNVTGVILNKTSLELEVGEFEDLVAIVSPAGADNKAVTWISSNPSVANVNSEGRVTAYAAGPATIIVTTDDGGFMSEAHVTVTATGPTKVGWHSEGGRWYHYNNEGNKDVGWLKDAGIWYFLDNSTGAMRVGWVQSGGKWYYMNTNNGAMRVGWVLSDGKWYYLNPGNGTMKVGWLLDKGFWYHLNISNGSMQTGWQKINNKWYFFDSSSGKMYADAYTPDGYYVDVNGVWN